METNKYDVIVVGAGLSGICAGYYLQKMCPNKNFIILEGRQNVGGTWDLFKYPGIRSDSDMYTMGYSFFPWDGEMSLANGKSILNYIHKTIDTYDLRRKIQCGYQVKYGHFSTQTAEWTLLTEHTNASNETSKIQLTCNFLYICCGYYDYQSGYTPNFMGMDKYNGVIVHPQLWDPSIDYADKTIIVIGSGATAVTLVPELAKKAKHVTMLQRSPTYIVSMPAVDSDALVLKRWLSHSVAHTVIRWKNILSAIFYFTIAKLAPGLSRYYIKEDNKTCLGEEEFKLLEKHFTPTYNPWDQRVCIVPDGDFFQSIKQKKVTMVTDEIHSFTENGLVLKSDCTTEIQADIIVTATGLNLKLNGGIKFSVDGREVDASNLIVYKGIMFSNVPNVAVSVGYTNNTWTLKCDLSCGYVCDLLNIMEKQNFKYCMPYLDPQVNKSLTLEPILNLSSGYIQRSTSKLPKQASSYPWKYFQNYLLDIVSLRWRPIKDDVLKFW